MRAFPSPLLLLSHAHTNHAHPRTGRPALIEIQWSRLFVALADSIRPAWLRRSLLDRVPIGSIQRMKTVCDVINARSLEIYAEKKKAIERGDQELLHAMGEGKDMLSILRALRLVCGHLQLQGGVADGGNSEGEHEGRRRG